VFEVNNLGGHVLHHFLQIVYRWPQKVNVRIASIQTRLADGLDCGFKCCELTVVRRALDLDLALDLLLELL
jgi:hypothetical protein